ncbi:MAG TPA: zinc metallopeptidase [Planctomycetota bacterium]|nr:zinc metallopeptidase [Planctomycetota bacterium]
MFLTIDPTYYLYALPGLILAIWAAIKVKMTYAKYSDVHTRSGSTGAWVARAILDAHGLQHVPVEEIPGELSDHYDPRAQALRLSTGVFRSDSVAAVGVAAHEAGHAIQHAARYWPMTVRAGLVPVAQWGPMAAIALFMIGAVLAHYGQGGKSLMMVGLVLFAGAALFSLVTLPVELNASNRAMKLLGSVGVLDAHELPGARKVLTAAALTYVAAAVQSLLTLVYYAQMLFGGSRDD